MTKARVLVGLVGFFLAGWLVTSLVIPNSVYSQLQSTPIPTPENPDLIENLQTLLSNEDCIFPCWLGWILGEDSLSDAQILMSRNFYRNVVPIQDLPHEQGYWRIGVAFDASYPYLDEYGLPINSGFTKIHLFVSDKDSRIQGGGLVTEQPRWSYVDWSAYGLDQVLTSYGIPDEVTISYPIDGTDAGYNLIIRYLELGIFINYGMVFDEVNFSGVEDTNGIPVCNHLAKIAVLQAWYQSQALPELDLASEWDDVRFTQDYEYSLAQVSHLDLAQFTELLSEPDSCFTTLPLDEWGRPQGQTPLN